MQHLENAQARSFTNPALVTFSRGIVFECKQTPDLDEGFYDELAGAAEDFERLFAHSPERFGASLKEIDKSNDSNFRGTISQLKLTAKHPNAFRADAASRILKAVEHLPNPTNMSYKNEYGTLTQYFAAFDQFSAEELALAMIDEWLQNLREGCQAYETFQSNRAATEAQEEQGATANARAALLAAYQDFTDHLEATLLLHPDEKFQDLFDRLNAFIKSNKPQTTKSKKKAASGNANEAASEAVSDAANEEA